MMKSIRILFFLLWTIITMEQSSSAATNSSSTLLTSNLRGRSTDQHSRTAVETNNNNKNNNKKGPRQRTLLLPQKQTTTNKRRLKWLQSHNILRQKYHTQYNTTYIPLKWSNSLQKQAREWSQELVKTCVGQAAPTKYGVNIAGKQGSRMLRSPHEILNGYEVKLNSSAAAAVGEGTTGKMGTRRQMMGMTQVLWRATEYVGCADARSNLTVTGGKKCSFSVCFYARPGNCNMNRYGDGDWWIPTFKDWSPCGPYCPPDEKECQ